MSRWLLASLVCASLNVGPAVAQIPCLTLSEGLRCINEARDSAQYVSIATAGEAAIFQRIPVKTPRGNCVKSGAVFLHAGDGNDCE